MTGSNRYPSQVFWSDEDEGFIAVAPDLPGCSAFGETAGEALAELQQAIPLWIGAAKDAGNPVPKPSQPAAAARHSGRFLLRLPRSLHAALANGAEADGVSLNQRIVGILTASVASTASAGSLIQLAAASHMENLLFVSPPQWTTLTAVVQTRGAIAEPVEVREITGGRIVHGGYFPPVAHRKSSGRGPIVLNREIVN